MIRHFISQFSLIRKTVLFCIFFTTLFGYASSQAYPESVATAAKAAVNDGNIKGACLYLLKYEAALKKDAEKADEGEAFDVFSLLGRIYFDYGDYESAAEKLSLADSYSNSSADNAAKSDILYLLTLSEIKCEDQNKASRTMEKLKRILSHNNDPLSRFRLKYLEAAFNDTFGSRRRAESLMNEAYSIALNKRLDSLYIAIPMLYLSDYRLEEGNFQIALQMLGRFDSWMASTDYIQTKSKYMNACMRAWTQFGNLDSAKYFQQKYFMLSDSLSRRDKNFRDMLSDIRKEIHNDYTKADKSDLYTFIAIVIVVFLLAAFLFYKGLPKIVSLHGNNRHTKQSLINAANPALQINEGNVSSGEPSSASITHSELLRRIREIVDQPENFTDPDFSLPRLADMAESNIKYVSSAIKNATGYNFRSFVNSYRIKEAARRLLDDAHYGRMTIQSIGESVGFVAQSAFIAAFRQFMGTTPSAFIKQKNTTEKTSDENPS